MGSLLRDFRFAFRSLRKSLGFSLVVVLTLGLGIGVNTAIFTLFDQVLLRQLPVREPQRLVQLDQPGANHGFIWGAKTFSFPMYRELRDSNGVFEGIFGYFSLPLNLTVERSAERVHGLLVSGDYFQTLGVRPAAGRLLTPEDDRIPGGHPLAVLSHDFWMRRFGGDSSIVGRDVRVNSQPMTVVGVSQRGFQGVEVGTSPDIFVPLMMKKAMTPTWDGLDSARALWLKVLARLKPGLTRDQAEAGVNVLYSQILQKEIQEMPDVSQRFRENFLKKRLLLLEADTGTSDLRGQFATPLKVLMGMVGLVLLIACANVSNLLIARSAARQRDTAIRLALGATGWQALRQLLAEALLLSAAGGAAGLLLANLTVGALLRTLPFEEAARSFSPVPDYRVLAFALSLSLVTALLAALAPVLRSLKPRVTDALKDASSSLSGTASQAGLRKILVAAQVALSMLLLIGAGLLMRSLSNLEQVDPGFRTENLLVFSIDPSLNGYEQPRIRQLAVELQDKLAQVPGVHKVSMAEVPLLAGQAWMNTITVDGYEPKEDENMNPTINIVGPEFFSVLDIPVLLGRQFLPSDGPDAPKVVLISKTMAQYFFGDANPLGRRLGVGHQKPSLEIVGVVGDGRFENLRSEAGRHMYFPLLQTGNVTETTYFLRSSLAPEDLSGRVRELVRAVDPNLPVYDLKTMQVQLSDSLFLERMVGALSSAFGGLAALLAAIGLYGVMAFSVIRRRREIGIRMALGADRPKVLKLVLLESLRVSAAGLAVGLLSGLVSARLLESQLFGLSPYDPATVAAAAAVLASLTLAAAYLPARRAAGVDPSLALRTE